MPDASRDALQLHAGPCPSDLELNTRVRHGDPSVSGWTQLGGGMRHRFRGNRTCAAQASKSITPRRRSHSPTFRTQTTRNSFALRFLTPPRGFALARSYYRPLHSSGWRPLQRASVRSASGAGRLTLDPPGRYEFMVRAGCGRQHHGHDPALERTADGLDVPAEVRRPAAGVPSGGSHRLTVGYGRPSKVLGVFATPWADLCLIRRHGHGVLRRWRADRHARAHGDDRLTRSLERAAPVGPSRTVSATCGDPALSPRRQTAGALRVKTKASLHISNHQVRRAPGRVQGTHRTSRRPDTSWWKAGRARGQGRP